MPNIFLLNTSESNYSLNLKQNKEELKLIEVNLKKARFALKNALILTYATSSIMFVPISAIVRIFAIDLGYGVMPLGLPLGEGDSLGYYWANLSLYAQIFSWVFATTLVQVLIAKKVNKFYRMVIK